jgi:ATP-binding cassette subfamily F protein 3
LFKDVNISIHRGDRVGVVGANGAGKSTILGMMEGAVPPDEGEVSIEKRIRTGVLRQELIEGLDRPILDEVMNVTDELADIRHRLRELEEAMEALSADHADVESVLEEHGRLQIELERYGGYSLEARALKVLAGLGFQPRDARRLWSEFSGGWRMRVALARILLAEPDLLLLDEPTNHLDLESLLWVEEYLSGFQGALVLVSHDRAFLNRLVKKIIEVDRGKATMFTGDYDQYERNKQMQEEIQLAAYRSQQDKIKHIQKFIDQNRVKARTASRVQSRVKMLEKLETVEPPSHSRTVKFTFPQPPPSGRRVVEIENMDKSYDSITVYKGFNLAIDRGDKLALVGPNGAGKSTLMKIIAGVVDYDGGSLKYGHATKVGYFAQHQAENLATERSVLEEASSQTVGMKESEIRSLLGAFLFSGDDVHKKVKVLSGGEKSRLALAKILLSPPNLLLMDEPTNHLDIASCRVLEEGLKKFTGTLALITHDRKLMNGICTGILEIEKGKAEYFPGNYDDYRYKKALIEKGNAAAVPPELPVVPAKGGPPASKEPRKDRKRKEAEARQKLSRKRAPIVEEVRLIEHKLERLMARRGEIQGLMGDPKNYEKRDLIRALLEEEPAVSREITDLEQRWETLQTSLQEIEQAAD